MINLALGTRKKELKMIDLSILKENPELAKSLRLEVNGADLLAFGESICKSAIVEVDIPLLNSNDRRGRYGTRKEMAKALHISLPTLNELTKSGILAGYKIQGRVLYKWEEVDQALTRIESIKYKRGQ